MTKKDGNVDVAGAPEHKILSNPASSVLSLVTPSTSPSRRSSSRHHSPFPNPIVASKSRLSPPPQSRSATPVDSPSVILQDPKAFAGELGSEDEDIDMDVRPALHRPTDGRSQVPLLKDERGRQGYDIANGTERPAFSTRRSTFRSRSPDMEGSAAVRKKYIYSGFFLLLSLVSFVVQTETAVYIQHELKWNKAYAMLYFTHGSWSLLWPTQLLILRIVNWKTPWKAFWRRHVYILWSTAQMVRSRDVHLSTRESQLSPVRYMVQTMAFVTTALTVAGGSWYVAVDLTSASDLTAIYNCSAFFAYAFSIPLLGDKIRFDKVFAVTVAIVGVLVIAYGDSETSAVHGGKSGGSVGGGEEPEEASHRTLGNIIIGIGSVLYGLYEVLYKRLACPPDGISPGRGMIFAMFFGTLIGSFTLVVLWIPLPILHILGIEHFVMPTGKTAWVLLISVLANATFSGSFLVLISLTSPVLSSVAALLTIFLVAIADTIIKNEPLGTWALFGGLLIIAAFILLSWATYREMLQDRRKRLEEEPIESDSDE